MSNEGKQINRRTFQEVINETLERIEAKIQRELEGKMHRAEMFRKENAGKARDYDMQADGLIDAVMIVRAEKEAISKGGRI